LLSAFIAEPLKVFNVLIRTYVSGLSFNGNKTLKENSLLHGLIIIYDLSKSINSKNGLDINHYDYTFMVEQTSDKNV